MTLDELNDYISKDLELADWMIEANRQFLQTVWDGLKVGGIWGFPADGSAWEKTEDGFKRII